VPIVSLMREDFAEARVLLKGIQDYSNHQILSGADFFEGNWDFLEQPLISPRQNFAIAKNGTETIAQAVIDYFKKF
jgi:hypothetical protein